VVPEVCPDQVVAPPSVVLSIVPVSPTAMQVFASVQSTERRIARVPEVCPDQVVAPPSVVFSIVPEVPTA